MQTTQDSDGKHYEKLRVLQEKAVQDLMNNSIAQRLLEETLAAGKEVHVGWPTYNSKSEEWDFGNGVLNVPHQLSFPTDGD